MTDHLGRTGVWGVLGLIAITLAMILAIAMLIRAKHSPTTSRNRGEAAKRGDNAGGVVRGSPAQQTRRDEADRSD